MIYEFRTYTLHPRALPEFLKRWTDALEPRLKLSPLAAFWYTEIGPLNQAIHVWPYENTLERSKIRAEAVKRGIWPPKTSELIAEMRSEIFEPLPYSPPLAPSNQGPYFEMRTLIVLAAVVFCACGPASQAGVPEYGYEVVHTYPHDRTAFTEGLFFQDGFLYESTGVETQFTNRLAQETSPYRRRDLAPARRQPGPQAGDEDPAGGTVLADQVGR